MSKRAPIPYRSRWEVMTYSQSFKVKDLIYVFGQIPVERETGEVVKGGLERQTKQLFDNLQSILAALGAGFPDIVMLKVYLKDQNDCDKLNRICSSYLARPLPLIPRVKFSPLPKDVLVGLEAIASVKQEKSVISF